MNWMDSAQAKHLAEDHEREEARKSKRSTPKTEADALRAYKHAHVAGDRKQIQQLEAHATANNWTALATWQTARTERIAAHKEIARRQAERIQTPDEAAARRKTAWDNGERDLVEAIDTTVRAKGWTKQMTQASRTPKTFEEYAAELNEQLMGVVAAHDATSAAWRDDLKNKRVTNEYVAQQIAASTNANRDKINGVLEGVNGYLNEAQSDYNRAYQALTEVTGDTNAQLLAEIRAGKTWERTKRELDALGSDHLFSETLNRISTADPSTLGVFIQELPSYLASKGLRDAADTVRNAVNTRPELRDAQARVTQATKLHTVVQHNAGHIDKRLDGVTYDDTKPTDIAYVDPTTVKY